jgi:valyl-tRNA synthetase
MANAENSTRLSDKYPIDVRVYVEKEALSVGDKNKKISKSKGVGLQPCDGMTEVQETIVYGLTSVRLILSIITDSLLG